MLPMNEKRSGATGMTEVRQFRVVMFKEGDTWVAQGLEHDIGAQAPDIETLQARFLAVVAAELEESVRRKGAPFAGIATAPEYYHDMWARQTMHFTPSPMPQSVNMQMALCA